MKNPVPILTLLGLLVLAGCAKENASVAPNGSAGTGGSLARFAVAGDKLYVVDQTNLLTFDVSVPTNPRRTTTVPIGIGIETVFPYGNNLFVGAADAMYIFDLSNPAQPRQLSRYNHFVGCDPVVVQGSHAYVTLRTTGCRPNVNNNVLDVINISDLSNPRVVNSLTMTSPYGLGVRGNALFVCEGGHGMRVFDVSDPVNPMQKSLVKDIKTYDVIPLPQTLLVIGQNGLLQYDYTDLTKLKLLSVLPVTRN